MLSELNFLGNKTARERGRFANSYLGQVQKKLLEIIYNRIIARKMDKKKGGGQDRPRSENHVIFITDIMIQ